jgi:hypothetical protein
MLTVKHCPNCFGNLTFKIGFGDKGDVGERLKIEDDRIKW